MAQSSLEVPFQESSSMRVSAAFKRLGRADAGIETENFYLQAVAEKHSLIRHVPMRTAGRLAFKPNSC
jgi:hypothetical protein